MFPKASLTRRVVQPNNTMRMAKSWVHRGGPVPALRESLISALRVTVHETLNRNLRALSCNRMTGHKTYKPKVGKGPPLEQS
jgi:hypothetical protein